MSSSSGMWKEPPKLLISGNIYYNEGFLKGYKQRWVELRGQTLTIYDEPNGVMMSYVEIGKNFKVSKDKTYFSLTGNSTTYKFRVDSAIEATNWEKALNDVISGRLKMIEMETCAPEFIPLVSNVSQQPLQRQPSMQQQQLQQQPQNHNHNHKHKHEKEKANESDNKEYDYSEAEEVLKKLNELSEQKMLPATKDIPLPSLFFEANKLWNSAGIYKNQNDIENAYLCYLKYANYTLQIIPTHYMYTMTKFMDERAEAKNKSVRALNELETLKEAIRIKYRKDMASINQVLDMLDSVKVNDQDDPSNPGDSNNTNN